MEKDRIICIDWVDSFHDSDWIRRKTARKSVSVSKCKTVGYLLKSNFKEITIFQSKSDTGNITDIMTIPKKAIKSFRFLGED